MRSIALVGLACVIAGCGGREAGRPGQQLNGLFLIRQNGRSGYVEKAGRIKIAPQFEQAAPFSDGLAVVSMGAGPATSRKTASFAINPQFESGTQFSGGLGAVRTGGAWGFIDHSGSMVIPAKFQDPGPTATDFLGRMAAVNRGPGTPIGYVDKTGKMAISPQFEYAQPFSDGLRWLAWAIATVSSIRPARWSSIRNSRRPAASSRSRRGAIRQPVGLYRQGRQG